MRRAPLVPWLAVGVVVAGCKRAPVPTQAVDAAPPPTKECLAADEGRKAARGRLAEGHLRAALAGLDAADAQCPASVAAGLADRVRVVAELARKDETAALVERIGREGDAAAKAAAAEASPRVAALAALSFDQLVDEALAPAEPALHAQRVERARDVLERDQHATARIVVPGPSGPVKQVTWDRHGVLFAHGPYVSAYDPELLRERARWTCGHAPVTSLVADEAVVVAATSAEVCLFDRRTLRPKGTLPHRAPVRLVAGKPWVVAATAADPKTVVVASLDTLGEVARLRAKTHLADTFDVSKDGRRLAIGAEVFELATGAPRFAPVDEAGEAAETAFVRFAPDGRRLAVARDAYFPPFVTLLDTTAGPAADGGADDKPWIAHVKRTPRDLAFSPNGAFLAVSGTLTVRLFLAKDGSPYNAPGSLHEHTDATTAVAWSPTGESLISSGDDGTVRAWNLMKGKSARSLHAPLFIDLPTGTLDAFEPRAGCAPGAEPRLAALRKARKAVLGCAGDTVAFESAGIAHVVDGNDKELWTKPVGVAVVDGTHRWLLQEDWDAVTVLALDTGKPVATVKTGPIVAVSPDGRVVSRRDEEGDLMPTLQGAMIPRGPLRLVDLATKKVVPLDPDPHREWRVAFLPGGDVVGVTVQGAASTLVRVSATTGKTLWTRAVGPAKALDVAPGSDGAIAVTAAGFVALHAASTGDLVRTVGPVPGPATFSPSGRALLARGAGQVTLHDVSTGALRLAWVHPVSAEGTIVLDGAGHAQAKPADRAHLACAIGARLVPVGLCEELFVEAFPPPTD